MLIDLTPDQITLLKRILDTEWRRLDNARSESDNPGEHDMLRGRQEMVDTILVALREGL